MGEGQPGVRLGVRQLEARLGQQGPDGVGTLVQDGRGVTLGYDTRDGSSKGWDSRQGWGSSHGMGYQTQVGFQTGDDRVPDRE